MMKYISLLLLCSIAFADTPPPGTVKAKTFTGDGVTGITAHGTALDVNVTNTSGLTTVNQGTGGASAWLVNVANASFPVTGTFWQSVQPVSLSSLPALATGSNTIGNVNINGTVPISGTVTATNPSVGTTGSAAPSSSTLVGGSDGTNLRALKTSSTGVLSVDGSAVTQPVSGTFWQATQPVSGTVTANAGTGTFTVDASGHTVPVSGTFWQATQPISAASLPLPTGASTAAKQPALGTAGTASTDVLTVQGIASMTALKVDGSAVTQPVSGTFWQATQPVSGTVTANAGTGTFAVSAASLPLPTGAATSALQSTINTTLGSPFQAGGSIGNTTFAATQGTAANLNATVVTTGGVTVAKDSSLSTINTTLGTPMQQTGGTVTANAGTGTFAVSASSLPLPTGAATAAKQPALGTAGTPSADVLTVQGAASMTALKVDGSAVTQPVSAASLPLPAGAATSALQTTGNTSLNSIDTKTPALGQTTMSASTPVTIASDQSTVGTTMPDLFFTGQAAQTATVNNIIPATSSANATDASGYRSASVQLICPAGTYTTGAVIFEGSNDNTNFQTIPVYSQLVLTGTPITAAITLATTTSLVYTFPVPTRYIRVRISTAITGASAQVQAFTKLSQAAWTPAVFQVAQTTAANLATTATIASGTVTTVSTVTSVTSDNLAIPGIIADVASAAITTTTTTATLTPTFGVGYKVTIPVTVVSGTLPTMAVAVQESGDTGTDWNTVYTFPTIISTGYYESPPLFFKGNRVRYVQTIGGTTPSFTRAINRLQMSAVAAAPVNNNATMVTATVPTTCSTLSAPANAVGFLLENLSSNTVNMFWSIGSTLATSTTGMLLEPGRDTGEVHSGSNVTLCAASGTPTYAIQWVQQ